MTVSIILPFYNRAHTLRRCVESVRAQTFGDWELVAVDDGSQDGSAALLESFGEPRFRVLRHERNRGPGAARNTALGAATGDCVAFLDSDDEWLPEKLKRQLAVLRRGEAEACGCEYERVEAGGAAVWHRLPEPLSWREDLHTRCEFTGSTLLVTRAAARATGPMAEELRVYEDWDWALRFAQQFRLTVLREPLVRSYFSGPRDPRTVARCAELFLARNETELRRGGPHAWRETRSRHYEFVAANALAQRAYRLGSRYLLRSVAAAPWRRPRQLGALPFAALDGVLGTSLLHRLAGWKEAGT